ncbi:MAG: hypothetical protein ABR529_06290 [Actinomycetota bacterium]
MEIEEALRAAQAELAKAQEAVERIPALEAEVKGLRLALARNGGPAFDWSPDHDEPTSPIEAWDSMSRGKAILRLLGDTEEPMSPADISDQLAKLGRPNDSPHYVSAVLSRLKKTGKVKSGGYGKWKVVVGE